MRKYQNFYLKIFIFLVVEYSVYLNGLVFVMRCPLLPEDVYSHGVPEILLYDISEAILSNFCWKYDL